MSDFAKLSILTLATLLSCMAMVTLGAIAELSLFGFNISHLIR